MSLQLTTAEFWNVVYRAYEAGYFGPAAKPSDPFPVQLAADRENLLHKAAGGADGHTPMTDGDRAQLVGQLENLFNDEIYVEVNDPSVTFSPPGGIRWRPRAAGPFGVEGTEG